MMERSVNTARAMRSIEPLSLLVERIPETQRCLAVSEYISSLSNTST
jgi:hypothetical protein